MIFLYLSSLFLIQTSTFGENSNSNYSNSSLKEKMHLNYIISCSDNLPQKIYITKKYYNSSISILNKSNIEITCSPEIAKMNNEIKLFIYDNPEILFVDDCYFNSIEIYGSPIIKTSQKANIFINNTILYNNSYHFPLHSNYINNSKNELKKKIQSEYDYCSYINIILSNVVNIQCEDLSITLNYKSLQYYVFKSNNYIKFINESLNDEDVTAYISLIISSLYMQNTKEIIFQNFLNISAITPIGKNLKNEGLSVYLSMDWKEYLKDDEYCSWFGGSYKPEYDFLESRFDDLVENFGWRKVCKNKAGYLYLQDEIDHKFIKISSAGSWIIIVSIFVLAVLIFILCIFIAYYKYKKIYD